jgi:hypothetical protein
MRTTTIRDVELVRAGTWPASTGPVTITTADLRAMMAAAADPEVDRAALKIGHVDPRFDGEPALGWVENLRLEGDRLVGDLVEVPEMLAELMPRAFRRRSVEIAWRVRTPAGATYTAALTALALLGVAAPAVKGLADVAALYGRTAATATIITGGAHQAGTLSGEFTTACTVGDLPAGDDPTDAALEAAMATLSAGFDALRDALATPSDPTIPTPAPSTSQNDADDDPRPPAGGAPMPVDESRIRELLGIEAEADLEAELERIASSIPDNAAGVAGDGTPAPTGTDGAPAPTGADGTPAAPAPGTPAPTGTTEGTPAPADAGDGTPAAPAAPEPALATLSAAALAELQAQAARGAAADEELARQRRDGLIATALSAGRIAPADQQAWRDRLDADEAGTTTLLSSLTPAFPTTELGHDGGTTTELAADEWAAFEAEVFGITPSKES